MGGLLLPRHGVRARALPPAALRDVEVAPDDQRLLRGQLARAGLDPDHSMAVLADAGLLVGGHPEAGLLDALSEAASPGDALLSVAALARLDRQLYERVRSAPDWFRRVVAVAG